jgi:ABC-2 type transport system permease protein
MGSPASNTAEIKRLRIGLNVAAQTVIVSIIVVMINYIGFNRYARWDISRDSKYALSELTKRFLKTLKKEVKIYVFFSPSSRGEGAELYADVQNLLKEYEAAGRRKIQVEMIDPYRNLTRARDLQLKYNYGSDENLVILDYQGRHKILHVADMAEFGAPGMFGDRPFIKAFGGEQVITSALIQLAEDTRTKIGYLTGHGEAELSRSGEPLRFVDYIQRQNVRVDPLVLANLEKIPGDYAAVILIGPQYDFSDRDLTLLRNYWKDQGRLMIALDPKIKTPKLDKFLGEYGIRADEDLIVTQFRTGIEEQSVTLDVYAQFLPEAGFLRPLSQATGFFPGGTRSLALDDAKKAQSGLTAMKMLTPAVTNYWGDKGDVLNTQNMPAYSEGVDLPPPLYFGIALERGSIKDTRVQLRASSRMVVVGNADFVRDEALKQSAPDVDFVLLCINWLADRTQLLGIAPKMPGTFMLNLSEIQMNQIVLLTVGGMPLLTALVGCVIWVARRR